MNILNNMDKETEEKINELREWVFSEIILLQKQIDEIKEKIKEKEFEKDFYGERD